MKYSVGDVVAIRRLKDLLCEFPLDSDGHIIAYGCFNKEQFQYCGHTFTVHESGILNIPRHGDPGYRLIIPGWISWAFYEGLIEDATSIV